MLISFAVTAQLICVFIFAYAKCWFSHDAAHLCKPIFSTKKRDHKRFDWLIRCTMQDVGLKYLHLSIDYETNIQILIDVSERHMAKETDGIKRKCPVKVSIDKELVNQHKLLSTNIFHSKTPPPWLQPKPKTPLHDSNPLIKQCQENCS